MIAVRGANAGFTPPRLPFFGERQMRIKLDPALEKSIRATVAEHKKHGTPEHLILQGVFDTVLLAHKAHKAECLAAGAAPSAVTIESITVLPPTAGATITETQTLPADSGQTTWATWPTTGYAVNPADEDQGQIADCWLLSSVNSIALTRPNFLADFNVLHLVDAQTVLMQLTRAGTVTQIKATLQVPVSTGAQSEGSSGVLYELIEKVMALWLKGQDLYSSLDYNNAQSFYNAIGISSQFASVYGQNANGINARLSLGPACILTPPTVALPSVVPGHEYAVKRTQGAPGAEQLVLINPWYGAQEFVIALSDVTNGKNFEDFEYATWPKSVALPAFAAPAPPVVVPPVTPPPPVTHAIPIALNQPVATASGKYTANADGSLTLQSLGYATYNVSVSTAGSYVLAMTATADVGPAAQVEPLVNSVKQSNYPIKQGTQSVGGTYALRAGNNTIEFVAINCVVALSAAALTFPGLSLNPKG
jgi:hypothetical protein